MSDWRHTFRALRHRDFRLYVFGQIVSLTGSWMQSLALSWLVYRLTHSTLLMGAVSFSSQIPVLLLGPVAGIVADRYPRRRVTMWMQALLMLQAAVLAVLTLTGRIGVPEILALALMLGVVNAFEIPARQSLYIHMVGREDLPNAIALNSMTFNAARVVGPSVAGFMVAAVGEGLCFALNAATFLAVLVSLALMRAPESRVPDPGAPLTRLREGLSYAWTHRPVRALLGLTALMNFASAPAFVLAPVFADAIFGAGSKGLGFLSGAFGLGAVIGTLALARGARRQSLPRTIWVSAIGVGASLAAYASAPAYAVAVAAIAFAGFSVMRQLAATNALIQSVISDDYRGRVMALYSMMVIGILPLGNLAGGAVAESIGARWTVAAGSILVWCGAAAFGRVRAEIQDTLCEEPETVSGQ